MTNQHDKEKRQLCELHIKMPPQDYTRLSIHINGEQIWYVQESTTTRYEAALREAKEALELSGNWMTEDAFYTAKSKALTTINEILEKK